MYTLKQRNILSVVWQWGNDLAQNNGILSLEIDYDNYLVEAVVELP